MQQLVSFYHFNLTGMSYQFRNFIMCSTIKIDQNVFFLLVSVLLMFVGTKIVVSIFTINFYFQNKSPNEYGIVQF